MLRRNMRSIIKFGFGFDLYLVSISFTFVFSSQDSFANAFFLLSTVAPFLIKIPPFSFYNNKQLRDFQIIMGNCFYIYFFVLATFVNCAQLHMFASLTKKIHAALLKNE